MFKIGDIIQVEVSGIEQYGIFVKTIDDYTGLIHISEIDNSFVRHINSYVNIGDLIYANILDIDNDNKHLSLSIKNMNYNNNDNDTRKIKESISGFLPLSKQLDVWTRDTLDQIKKEQ